MFTFDIWRILNFSHKWLTMDSAGLKGWTEAEYFLFHLQIHWPSCSIYPALAPRQIHVHLMNTVPLPAGFPLGVANGEVPHEIKRGKTASRIFIWSAGPDLSQDSLLCTILSFWQVIYQTDTCRPKRRVTFPDATHCARIASLWLGSLPFCTVPWGSSPTARGVAARSMMP